MVSTDKNWYRNADWTPEAQKQFFEKIARSKNLTEHYILTKASFLTKTKNIKLVNEAIGLINFGIENNQISINRLASAYNQIAGSYKILNDIENATRFYKESISWMFQSNERILVVFDYVKFVIKNELKNEYDEVLKLLDNEEKTREIIFPNEQFEMYAARAIIYRTMKDMKQFEANKSKALEISSSKSSGIKNHPTTNLVSPKHWMMKEII